MSSYLERQKSLFNTLKDAEDQYSYSKSNKVANPPNYGEVDRRTYRKLKHEMKQFRGKESIYKRPEANMRDCLRAKTIPDYITNPKKWVYYSLEDVTPEQMSEKTNTATALALMQKLEEQAAKTEMDIDSDDALFKKPIFQVSSTIKKTGTVTEEKAVFKSNKVVMPEYVVGQKVLKKKEKPARKETAKDTPDVKASLALNHLFEEEDEE